VKTARASVICALAVGIAWLSGPARLEALEIRQGLIRLVIHEHTGRFSLYYLSDPGAEYYEPLFSDQDPRTSFLAVNVNGRVYRLGESPVFAVRIVRREDTAALVFESPFLLVRQEFAFIKTAGSALSNGVKITVWVKNLDAAEVPVGLRMLIDTGLGEGPGTTPFVTDLRQISAETVLNAASEDMWWVSQNSRLSLTGSVFAGMERPPDMLHFSNWKRLSDMPWKAGYNPGRDFNYPPYSIGDSADSYYYEPEFLRSGETASFVILLAAGEAGGFDFEGELSPDRREEDLSLLRELLARLDRFIRGEIVLSAGEVADMERTVSHIKVRNGLP
jgi:hypothetical protein